MNLTVEHFPAIAKAFEQQGVWNLALDQSVIAEVVEDLDIDDEEIDGVDVLEQLKLMALVNDPDWAFSEACISAGSDPQNILKLAGLA